MTSSTTSAASNKLGSLTGLRFVAAVCVVLEHFDISSPFVPSGWVAVSFFFVLSGFVMVWSVKPSDSAASFWRRRFWKMVPNHVAIWIIMMVFLGVTGYTLIPGVVQPGATPAGPAIANLFLVHAWVPSFEYTFSVVPATWTLCCELLFYALFPTFLPLVRRIPTNRLPVVAVGCVALVWSIPLVSLTFSGPELYPGSGLLESQYWFADFFPPSRLPEFLLGMVLAQMVRQGFTPRIGIALPGIASITFIFLAPLIGLPSPFLFAAVAIVPVALVVLGAASMDARSARSWWRHPIMVFLGDISFALYLVHIPVNEMFRLFWGQQVTAVVGVWGTHLIVFALCLFASWSLSRLVEGPFMRRFGRRVHPLARINDPRPES